MEKLKIAVAHAAMDIIKSYSVIGLGSGSTVNHVISVLARERHRFEGIVAASEITEKQLRALGISILSLNDVGTVPLYLDGADEFNPQLHLLKGAGGALTREKIIACASKKFICLVDQSKQVSVLGRGPLAIEVIPMARSYVARQLLKLGGFPNYREGFITDNSNCILDVYHLDFSDPYDLEQGLNNITGVVCHGLFAQRCADQLLLAADSGVQMIDRKGS
jgi:ribose 5-phosphate isomerase A